MPAAPRPTPRRPIDPPVRATISFCLGLVVLLVSGCAGYRLGPTNGELAGARSLRIMPFYNQTLVPGLSDSVMNALRKTLQRDGTYRLETHADEGDIILTGVIKTYTRSELSYGTKDVVTVLDYEIVATAQITARERSTGKVLMDKPVRATTTLRAGNDLTSAERMAQPVLAENLARKATELLVDGSW